MNFKEGQWMYNWAEDGNWGSSEYFDIKEDAIKYGLEEFKDDRSQFYVGQIAPYVIKCSIDVDNILERVAENVYDEVGDAADDYLKDVKKEHYDQLEERLTKTLNDWMEEFIYHPNFFKIINTTKIEIE